MINKLVHEVMELLLAGDELIIAALRAHYVTAKIETIELTGVGGYINYSVPEAAINLPETLDFCYGDVEGQIVSLKNGVGFLLWIKRGVLDCLEFYTYDEPWPEMIAGWTVSYIGGERNFDVLRKSLPIA